MQQLIVKYWVSSSEYSVKNFNYMKILDSCPFKKEQNEDNTTKR